MAASLFGGINLYYFNEEYKTLKAYDARSFIIGLKEVCNINIDVDKSYIGTMFSYRLLVDNEYIDIYNREDFMEFIANKIDIDRNNFYSYMTTLDYQIKLKNTPQENKNNTVENNSTQEEKPVKKNTRTKKDTK